MTINIGAFLWVFIGKNLHESYIYELSSCEEEKFVDAAGDRWAAVAN